MSLDISILDSTGAPAASVSLGVDEHWAIVEQVRALALPLWGRMSDYYEDADYDTKELEELVAETAQLQHVFQDSHGLHIAAKLQAIEELLRTANSARKKVSAIAD